MLKGWTLTAAVCPHCRTTPIMREPSSQSRADGRTDAQRIEFCGRCQGGPGLPVRPDETSLFGPPNPLNLASDSTSTSTPQISSPIVGVNGHPVNGHGSHFRNHSEDSIATSPSSIFRPSSPSMISDSELLSDLPAPTASNATSSMATINSSTVPTFTSRSPPQGPRTISQSDQASSASATLLLRGYTLLSEVCPNATCRGIPLMGHPKRMLTNGQVKKECVVCHRIYGRDMELLSGGSGDEKRAGGAVNASGTTGQNQVQEHTDSVDARKRALYEYASQRTHQQQQDEGLVEESQTPRSNIKCRTAEALTDCPKGKKRSLEFASEVNTDTSGERSVDAQRAKMEHVVSSVRISSRTIPSPPPYS